MEKNSLTYEDAMGKLEKILEELENEDTSLLESLEKFKDGINLYNHCSEILKKAEGEVKILLDNEDTLEEFDFLREDEDEYY